ncbi:3711_t:CDS:2 [Funneliformis geosporum]|uniref:3711_t:CDS:1 n=1 Tax=Funneliformis geosporum TaxID=1117311 RepID=A0A9W4SJW0_9GLOM|nr:3711_t:CDS:2 [Funneliformis geosporum]
MLLTFEDLLYNYYCEVIRHLQEISEVQQNENHIHPLSIDNSAPVLNYTQGINGEGMIDTSTNQQVIRHLQEISEVQQNENHIHPLSIDNSAPALNYMQGINDEEMIDTSTNQQAKRKKAPPCTWEKEPIYLLLAYINDNKEKITLLKCRGYIASQAKKELWPGASIMLSEHGHIYTDIQCAVKWKNLLQGYNVNII